MSGSTLELVDASIVMIPDDSYSPLESAALVKLFEASRFKAFLRQPLSLAQTVMLDASNGTPMVAIEIESTRSQKSVSLAPKRIELHDRAEDARIELQSLPEFTLAVAEALGLSGITAIGANYVYHIENEEGERAGQKIAEKLLISKAIAPPGTHVAGSSVRLFLESDEDGIKYLISTEPRLGDLETSIIWAAMNLNATWTAIPSQEKLTQFFESGYKTMKGFLSSYFIEGD